MTAIATSAEETGGALLADRVVFVTGGSRGIGAAAAELLARNGAKVGVNYRSSPDRAHAVVLRIERAGGRAIAVPADVARADEIAAAMKTVREEFGPIDTLVLNASGHSGEFVPRPLVEQDAESIGALVTEQLQAVLTACRVALPDLKERGHGDVIVVGSGMSRSPVPGFGALSVAKAAVDALARALANELGPLGVRVNVVAPGFVATDTSDRFVGEEARRAIAARTPLGRTADPRDIAGAILMLASDHARFLTGVRLPVTGGTA